VPHSRCMPLTFPFWFGDCLAPLGRSGIGYRSDVRRLSKRCQLRISIFIPLIYSFNLLVVLDIKKGICENNESARSSVHTVTDRLLKSSPSPAKVLYTHEKTDYVFRRESELSACDIGADVWVLCVTPGYCCCAWAILGVVTHGLR
jgi:hypothetical protein